MWEADSPPIFVVVICRPPDVAFCSDPHFIKRLRPCCSEYSHKIIIGDWNIDMSDPRDPDYKSMREFIDAESLQLIAVCCLFRPTQYSSQIAFHGLSGAGMI